MGKEFLFYQLLQASDNSETAETKNKNTKTQPSKRTPTQTKNKTPRQNQHDFCAVYTGPGNNYLIFLCHFTRVQGLYVLFTALEE